MATEGAQILANLLQKQSTSLCCLNVDFNELGDDGVCIILEPFAAARNCLEELSLNGNEVEKRGAEALVRATLPKLKRLSLDDNMGIPKKYLRAKYGDKVFFGDDDDDDDADEDEGDKDMNDLISHLAAVKV